MQAGETPTADDKFASLKAPDIADMQLQLEQLVQQGVLTPEQAQAQLADSSAMNDVRTDPAQKKAQMDALLGLQDISGNGGMTLADEANLSKIGNQENAQAKGQREAILQNAQSRGLGGSGLELMSQMQNQQDSATRQSARDLDVAGMAQDRALSALIQGGQLGGQMQAQDFGQKAQVAGANDAISQFNAQNKQQTNMANVGANNQAQAQNLSMRQGVADANVDTRNQQQQNNKNLLQQNFQNELAKRGGAQQIANVNAQIQGQNSQNRANAQNQTIGIGAGIVSGGLTSAASAGAGSGGGQKKAQVTAGQSYGPGGYGQQNTYYSKNGGIVPGEDSGIDSQPSMLQPGEMVIRKDDVPEMLKNAHTNDKGEFDAAAFLDAVTGHKYGYGKKGK